MSGIVTRIRESLGDAIGRLRGDTATEGRHPEGEGEPFPGYDGVDERELIDQLHKHSQAELEAVEAYERSHESRIRVLNKLHYLRQSEPLPGYDALSVEEISAALADADLATIKNIRAYERKFHNRPAVQDEVERARRRHEGDPPAGTPGYHATSYGPSASELGSRAPGPGRLAANKTLATSFYAEAMSAHDLDSIERLLSEEFIHNGEVRGRRRHRETLAAFLDAFPDLRTEIDLILAEGDLVSVHQRWTGTHRGTVAGVGPTGRRVEFTSTTILRIHDGLITEAWDEIDLAGMLAKLTGDE